MHPHHIPYDAICTVAPPRYPADHYDLLRRLDPRLERLHREVSTGDTPQTMPGYWHRWRAIERRLADICRRPAHPFLRTRYALRVAHDGLRRAYWEGATR